MSSSASHLEYSIDRGGRATVLTLRGCISLDESDTLDHMVDDVTRGGDTLVVVDLSAVLYITSLGIRSFIQLYRVLSDRGGELRLAAPSESVEGVLRVVALHRVVPIFKSVRVALVAE